jgi:uncharacterized protein YjbJ (UPF0337 family)
MNWDRIQGNWKQLHGKAKQQWGRLTDDHLDVISGQREELLGKIQEIYDIEEDEAEEQIRSWELWLHQTDPLAPRGSDQS